MYILDSGKKLITTLHFNKVKKEDEGTYECVGHSSGKQDPYGFTINVITSKHLAMAINYDMMIMTVFIVMMMITTIIKIMVVVGC